MRSGLVLLTTARPVNTAQPRTTVNIILHQRDNYALRIKLLRTVRPKAVVNAARPKTILNAGNPQMDIQDQGVMAWGNPQMDLQDQGVIDSGCSWHMTWNMSYLLTLKDNLMEDMCIWMVTQRRETSQAEGSRPNWLFDIDAQTKSINYKPVVTGNQSNGNADTKACDDAGKASMEKVPGKEGCKRHCDKEQSKLVAHGWMLRVIFFMVKVEREVYVCQTQDLKITNFPDRVYKSRKGTFGLYHSQNPDIMFTDLPFDLVAYIDSDYARASLDRKSTTGGIGVNAGDSKLRLLGINLLLLEKVNADRHNLLLLVAKTVNGEVQLQALVDRKKIIITEATIRRDLQLEDADGVDFFLDKQVGHMSTHDEIFVTTSHTKKVFGNMKRVGKGFSREVTSLFPNMLVQAQEEMGEEPVVDEVVYEERDDSLERATSTAASLDTEQDRGNIAKIQSKATLNEPSPQGTGSGSGPRCQDTILGDAKAQTRFETASKQSNDPPLLRVNILGSGEDRLKLKELMELCTKLSDRVLNLETTKTAQAKEIANLKKRVNKLEKKKKSRTHKLKRLYKVGLSARIVSSDDEASLGTLAQALAALKSAKVQEKGDVIKEPSVPVSAASTKEQEQAPTPIVSSQQPTQVKDKGKGKMVEEEPVKKMSKKYLLKLDEELALKLQAEEDKEERLARE
ncbi:hypothetical protein Tco_0972904 [Tanacetum coccineum]